MRFRIVLCLACVALLSLSLPTLSAPARPTYSALHFDGFNDYVEVMDPIQCTTGPFTLEAWIWLEDAESDGRIVCNRSGGAGYEMDMLAQGGGVYRVRLGANAGTMMDGYIDVAPQTWTHLAGTWAGTTGATAKIYANGELVNSADWGYEINPSSGSFYIGSLATGTGFFHGVIDDVRVWSVVLDQATIQTWMWKPIDASHPNYANLEGYWPFDEGSGQLAATLAHSPARDGQLGEEAGEDGSDPVWTTNVSPVPVEPTSFGRIKGSWLLSR